MSFSFLLRTCNQFYGIDFLFMILKKFYKYAFWFYINFLLIRIYLGLLSIDIWQVMFSVSIAFCFINYISATEISQLEIKAKYRTHRAQSMRMGSKTVSLLYNLH
jgi:hypothetical protein